MTSADPFALRPPTAVPEAAASAVTALIRVAVACDEAGRLLERTIGLTAAWTGEASQAFQEQRIAVTARCAGLAEASGAAAGALARWWPEAAADKAAMLRAAGRVDLVHRQELAAAAAGSPYRPDLTAEHDAAMVAWNRAQDDWTAGAVRARQGLHAVRSQVRDRPMAFGDHAEEFAATLWDRAVASPVTQAWALTGQAFVDRDGWWRDVRAVPGEAKDAVERLFTDPLGLFGDVVDAQAWRDGHLGEGAGALAAVFAPGPRGTQALKVAKPVLQSVDDLFRGIDLARHEHPELGHTLSRHVEVTDAYLVDRLRNGTRLPDGTRGFIPSSASRFFDRATADAAITEALLRKEKQITAFAAGRGKDVFAYHVDLGRELGIVMAPDGRRFTTRVGTGLFVRLRRNSDGIYLETAYVEIPHG